MSNALTPAQWNQLPKYHETVIPPEYIDGMGHMNVMWYTNLVSIGLWGFFQKVGLTRDYFVQNRCGSFALEQNIRYMAEVREGERVSVRLRALGRSAKKLHFMCFLIKDDTETLSATAELVTAHIDMKVRRTAPFPDHIAQAYDEFLREHEKLDWQAPVNGVMKP